jgi:hypothetical protein
MFLVVEVKASVVRVQQSSDTHWQAIPANVGAHAILGRDCQGYVWRYMRDRTVRYPRVLLRRSGYCIL